MIILLRKTETHATHSGPLPDPRAPVTGTGFRPLPPASGIRLRADWYAPVLAMNVLPQSSRQDSANAFFFWDMNLCRSIFRADSSLERRDCLFLPNVPTEATPLHNQEGSNLRKAYGL